MDSNHLKGRIAETLVEGILRRAGYRVALAGRETRVQALLKVRTEGFIPDLLAWRQTDEAHAAAPRLIPVDVKYRLDIETALTQEAPQLAVEARQWRHVHFVFVTESPERGRSCFQVLDLSESAAVAPWRTADLHEVTDLDIYWHTVEEYEQLVKMMFPILSGAARASRPPQRLPGRITALRVSR